MLAGFTHRPVVELSERLAALAPPGLAHAFYASDGASATEIALKMSFHHWQQRGARGKDRYARLAGGYHGETVGALEVTEDRKSTRLNSSHPSISYAVFCLKKKKKKNKD